MSDVIKNFAHVAESIYGEQFLVAMHNPKTVPAFINTPCIYLTEMKKTNIKKLKYSFIPWIICL